MTAGLGGTERRAARGEAAELYRVLHFGTHSIIDGQDRPSERTFAAVNPASGAVIAEVSEAGSDLVDAAIVSAKRAAGAWARVPVSERERAIGRILAVVLEHRDGVARLVTTEQGAPLAEALAMHVLPVCDHAKYLSRQAGRILRTRRVDHAQVLFAHKQARLVNEPLGVVSVISPWNYPFCIPFIDVLQAIAAGNAVVLKPAAQTALVGVAIGELCRRAGLAPGVVNVVTARRESAERLMTHADVAKIVFTGSVESGSRIMAAAAGGPRPVVLELGGKDPAVVAADADVERTARGLVWGAFTNCGQTCAAVERVYVEQPVAGRLIARCVELAKSLRVGDPLDEATELGPMTSEEQRRIVHGHVTGAVAAGAGLEVGGEVPAGPGYFYPPTVLTRVDHSMEVMTRETFGPVLPFMVVGSLDEAIELANDSPYALTASVWSRSRDTGRRVAERLQAGTVTVNDTLFTFCEPTAPWGGPKCSGIGRTHSGVGLLEMTSPKYVSLDPGDRESNPWWYPYGPSAHEFLAGAFPATYGSLTQKAVAFARLLRNPRFRRFVHLPSMLANWRKLL